MIVEPDPEKAFEYSNPCFGQIGFLQHTCCLIRECAWHRIPLVRQIRSKIWKSVVLFYQDSRIAHDCPISNLAIHPPILPSIIPMHVVYLCVLDISECFLPCVLPMHIIHICNYAICMSTFALIYPPINLHRLSFWSCWTAPWGLPKTGSLQVWQIASNFFWITISSCSLQVQKYDFI